MALPLVRMTVSILLCIMYWTWSAQLSVWAKSVFLPEYIYLDLSFEVRNCDCHLLSIYISCICSLGACVTSSLLCDARVAVANTTFLCPFGALGLPAEGCSSFLFPQVLGNTLAQQMLTKNRKLTAEEALKHHFVDEIVEDQKTLMLRARTVALQWAQQGRPRKLLADESLRKKLQEVNRLESIKLGQALFSKKFLNAQYEFYAKKKKTSLARSFWIASALHPILSRLWSIESIGRED